MFAKIIENGFITAIGTGIAGAEITESEYNTIMQKIQNKPTDPSGYTYKLRADTLEWELVELPPAPEPSEDVDDSEALTRYANELTGANDPDLISAAETLITDRIKEEK